MDRHLPESLRNESFRKGLTEFTTRYRVHLLTLLAITTISLCSGCGSMSHQFVGPAQVYGGVHKDCDWIGEGDWWAALDVPFSVVADTLFLPADWPLPDPVKGWAIISDVGCWDEPSNRVSTAKCFAKMPPEIVQDINRFIDKLPDDKGDWGERRKGRDCMTSVTYYKSQDKRHAVRIGANYNSSVNYYVLYAPSNVRTKVMKVRVRYYFRGFGDIEYRLYEKTA